MRYLSLIFIVILVALKSNAQKSYSSIIEDSIINDFVGGIDVRNSFKNGRQIKTICKTIGVWSEEDLRQIELSANAVPWLKLHSEFINKQILSLNKLSLWNFDLPKKMKFLAYHYNDTICVRNCRIVRY